MYAFFYLAPGTTSSPTPLYQSGAKARGEPSPLLFHPLDLSIKKIPSLASSADKAHDSCRKTNRISVPSRSRATVPTKHCRETSDGLTVYWTKWVFPVSNDWFAAEQRAVLTQLVAIFTLSAFYLMGNDLNRLNNNEIHIVRYKANCAVLETLFSLHVKFYSFKSTLKFCAKMVKQGSVQLHSLERFIVTWLTRLPQNPSDPKSTVPRGQRL